MTTKFVVTDEQERVFQKRRRDLERRFLEDNALDPEVVNAGLQLLLEGGAIREDPDRMAIDWIIDIITRERQCHRDFFGNEFYLSEFENMLRKYGRKKIKFWQKQGLEPHFLPGVSMMPGDEYPGWKVKPERRFYQQLLAGKIFVNINDQLEKVTAIGLDGITVLVDTRLKPDSNRGTQLYENDNLLGQIIERLRK